MIDYPLNKLIPISIENLFEKSVCGAILIETDNLLYITNNITSDENKIYFYNFDNKINKSIEVSEQYTFNLSQNNLSFMNIEEKKEIIILLCACKKYIKNQKNGILLVTYNFNKNNKITNEFYEFYDTDSFEVYCFCPLSIFEEKNIESENEIKKMNYFLVGGFEPDKSEGIIRLYKLINEEDKIKIEFIDDDIIKNYEDNTFIGFKGPISCLIQAKKNGKILATSWDGNIYYFDAPNKKYFEEIELINK